MSHLDEGTLHALLDGELDLAEVSEIQTHLGTCVACGSRLQEVRQVLAEADRLVGAVEMPPGAGRPKPEPPRTSSPNRPFREPEIWDTPVLLLPDSADALARRRRWMRALRWAAMIVVVIGAGRILSSALRPSRPVLSERDLTSATPAVPPAVVSPQEARRPTADAPKRSRATGTVDTRNTAAASKMAARSESTARTLAVEPTREFAGTAAQSFEDSAGVDSQALAASDSADTHNELAVAAGAGTDTAAVAESKDEAADQPTAEDELATRRAAAAALAELDRERRRARANAATAALPPPRAEPPPTQTVRPPTLEERAQVYLRIGLDEAVKQLGRPVHVIEGMSPQLIGLTQGRSVAGADPARPVVRVVYLDSRGRMILLDQQRMRPGQAPGGAAGNLRWTIGDVMLYLRGEPSAQVLRSLQARVR